MPALTAFPRASAAYFEDVVVGAVSCRVDKNAETGAKTLYIMTLVVLGHYRRRGIGLFAAFVMHL